LLPAFSQAYNESWEKKYSRKVLKYLQFAKKRSTCKVGAKEHVAIKEIMAINERSCTLHQRKDPLKSSQELARLYPSKSQECKGFKPLYDFGLRREF
jgi:hypothetical protein